MSDRTVPFGGEDFKVADSIGNMALMRFAHVAQKKGTNEVEEWAALYDLCSAVIAAEDWDRFMDVAVREEADDKTLMLLVRKVLTGQTDRPTSRPSDSSDGPESTEQSSVPDSSSPAELHLRVIRRLEEEGRPDKALMVQMARETTSAA